MLMSSSTLSLTLEYYYYYIDIYTDHLNMNSITVPTSSDILVWNVSVDYIFFKLQMPNT